MLDPRVLKFLETLPAHIGASPAYVFRNIIDTSRGGSIEGNEIHSYIARARSKLETWYGGKTVGKAYIDAIDEIVCKEPGCYIEIDKLMVYREVDLPRKPGPERLPKFSIRDAPPRNKGHIYYCWPFASCGTMGIKNN